MIKQYYYPYTEWEDYQNGMFEMPNKDREVGMADKAREVLINPYEPMMSVIVEWEKSTKHNLSKKATNKLSWLGQAACCYQYGIPEHVTRSVWNKLTEEERENANKIAQQIVSLWEKSVLIKQ